MPESEPVIGLTWQPKFPGLSSDLKHGSSCKSEIQQDCNILWKANTELIDGLFVPPNNPKKLNKLRRKEVKDTAGKDWFDMPAPTLTPELTKDLKLLKLRGDLDPKRFYKKGGSSSKSLPKYFQIGTVVESATDFYDRLTKKERKQTLADELLSDTKLAQYRKRKVREIEGKNIPGGNEKWKIKGRQTLKRAKQRRKH